jgi:hypothetical protein
LFVVVVRDDTHVRCQQEHVHVRAIVEVRSEEEGEDDDDDRDDVERISHLAQ